MAALTSEKSFPAILTEVADAQMLSHVAADGVESATDVVALGIECIVEVEYDAEVAIGHLTVQLAG